MFRVIQPVTSTIDSIINCFVKIFYQIFAAQVNNGYMTLLINTITSNPLLLITCSLVVIGFVFGIIKRLISS